MYSQLYLPLENFASGNFRLSRVDGSFPASRGLSLLPGIEVDRGGRPRLEDVRGGNVRLSDCSTGCETQQSHNKITNTTTH